LTDETLKGILVVDKPAGWTSHDVVGKTRRLLGIKKVGHTGTLDPMATGVLVLLVGSATKQAKRFENDDKRYRAEITFGRATDSFDATGTTIAEGDPELIGQRELLDAIDSFIGVTEQMPPMFSAVKVDGKKLYTLARQGKTIERKPRSVTIYSMDADVKGFPTVTLDIHCSKGTYIRAIAHDLGEKVGCPAHLSALRRTASGRFTIDDAVDFMNCAQTGNAGVLKEAVRPLDDCEEYLHENLP